MKILATLVAFLVAGSLAAQSTSGKVRSRIGEADLQKDGKGEWKNIKVGNKVNQGDYIRTRIESQVIVALPDGSSFSVEENSLVSLSEMMSEDGVNRVTAEVKSGKIKFDVQKQNGSESHFKFKTGVATAAIRGTNGLLFLGKNGPVAALFKGKMDMFMGKQAASIHGNQAILTFKNRLIVIDFSSEDANFLDQADSLASDTTLTESDFINRVKSMDSLSAETLKKLKETISCQFEALPDTIRENSVVIKAQCPAGIKVSIGGELLESDGNGLTFTPNWESSQGGEKKFNATCHVGKVSFNCGSFKTFFISSVPKDTTAKHQPLTITTKSPLKVCDPASATIEGIFDYTDPNAILTVRHGGKTSENILLNNPNGQLRYTISIKDNRKNWNSDKVEVEYTSSKFGTERASIDLAITKSCKTINTVAPKISITNTDSLKCFVKVFAEDVPGDKMLMTTYVDGVRHGDQLIETKGDVTQSTTAGRHKYLFVVEDLAGNKGEISRTVGCYPKTDATLEVFGGGDIRLRVPPAPENLNKPLYQMLRFRINNIPGNNTQYIKYIQISQTGGQNVILRETDIHSVSIDRQVVLPRGKRTEFKITVYLKSGETLTATKIYRAF